MSDAMRAMLVEVFSNRKGGKLSPLGGGRKMVNGPMAPVSPTSEIHPSRVALRLIALREVLGLSKTDFANAIGVDKSSYTKIEAGNKPLTHYMAHRVCILYGCTMEFLYRGSMSERDLPESHAQAIRTRLVGHQ